MFENLREQKKNSDAISNKAGDADRKSFSVRVQVKLAKFFFDLIE